MQIDTPQIEVDGSKMKFAIVLPYFNESLGKKLLENVKKELIANNVQENNIEIYRTAGALETPFACKKIIDRSRPLIDGVIALGVVVKGDTSHYDLVCQTTYQGLMKVQLESDIPIAFGILTCETLEQAEERVSADKLNKGKEIAQAALIQTRY